MRRDAKPCDQVVDPLLLLVALVEQLRELVQHLLALAALQHRVVAMPHAPVLHPLFLLLLRPVQLLRAAATPLRDGVHDLFVSAMRGANGDEALEGERVDGGDGLALAGQRVVVEAVAEPFVEVGALRVAVVLGMSGAARGDVGVEVDHDGGLLAEVEKTLERRFLREELVRGGGLAGGERGEGSERVGEADVDGGEEHLKLDLEKGLEVLEEVEDHAQRQRENGRVVRLRVLDDVFAEGALQQLDQRRVVHEHVAIHLQQGVDG